MFAKIALWFAIRRTMLVYHHLRNMNVKCRTTIVLPANIKSADGLILRLFPYNCLAPEFSHKKIKEKTVTLKQFT